MFTSVSGPVSGPPTHACRLGVSVCPTAPLPGLHGAQTPRTGPSLDNAVRLCCPLGFGAACPESCLGTTVLPRGRLGLGALPGLCGHRRPVCWGVRVELGGSGGSAPPPRPRARQLFPGGCGLGSRVPGADVGTPTLCFIPGELDEGCLWQRERGYLCSSLSSPRDLVTTDRLGPSCSRPPVPGGWSVEGKVRSRF